MKIISVHALHPERGRLTGLLQRVKIFTPFILHQTIPGSKWRKLSLSFPRLATQQILTAMQQAIPHWKEYGINFKNVDKKIVFFEENLYN